MFRENNKLAHFVNRQTMVAAVYLDDDRSIYEELQQLAQIVGVQLVHSRDDRVEGVLEFSSRDCADFEVKARFHPDYVQFFSSGQISLHVKNDCAEILELMTAVAATMRGDVLGVVGVKGGIGVSSSALWIARELTRQKQSVALIDFNPASAGIDLIISQADQPGKRWADLTGSGAMLGGRLNQALPVWHGVKILSGDSRGGVDFSSDVGSAALSALSQVNDCTVLDLPTFALTQNSVAKHLLSWCDNLLLLTTPNLVAITQTQEKIRRFPKRNSARKNILIAVMNVQSQNQLAHIRQLLQPFPVFPIRYTRGYDADLEHGLAPGDRNRSKTAHDVRAICAQLRIGERWER